MTLPFPVAFWGSGEGAISVIDQFWADVVSVSENVTHDKDSLRTWSDNVSFFFEQVAVSKTNIKAVTVPETVSVTDTWGRTIISLIPNAPSGLSAVRQANAGGVSLFWTDNSSNETAFVVERSLNGITWSEAKTVGAGLTSTTDWATIPLTIPVVSSIDSQNDDKINVSWGSVANATAYNIYRSSVEAFVPGDSNSIFVGQTTSTNYQITGLNQNTIYFVIVQAVNAFGGGGFCEPVLQQTGPTVPQSFSYVYGGSSFFISWSNGNRDDDQIELEISLNSGGTWSPLNTLSPGTSLYSDTRAYSANIRYRARYVGETTYAT